MNKRYGTKNFQNGGNIYYITPMFINGIWWDIRERS